MVKEFNNVTVELIADKKTLLDKQAVAFSWFCQGALSFDERIVVGNLSQSIKKDTSLGKLWPDIQPKRGYYSVELGTELPYFLPRLNNKAEFLLNVDSHNYFVCNRMIKAYFGEGLPKDEKQKYYLLHRLGLQKLLKEKDAKEGIHPVVLRTFVSRRFRVKGQFADSVIDKYFLTWQQQLFEGIHKILRIFKISNPEWTKIVLPHPSSAGHKLIWVILRGKGNKWGFKQFASDLGLAAFRPTSNIGGHASTKLKKILAKSAVIEPYVEAIELARTFIHYALYDLAIVQICVACESILSVAIEQKLKTRGVSNTTIKGLFSDITFSQLLNFHLQSLFKMDRLIDCRNIIGDINWARKRRNEVIHNAQPNNPLRMQDMHRVFGSALKLINFLEIRTKKD